MKEKIDLVSKLVTLMSLPATLAATVFGWLCEPLYLAAILAIAVFFWGGWCYLAWTRRKEIKSTIIQPDPNRSELACGPWRRFAVTAGTIVMVFFAATYTFWHWSDFSDLVYLSGEPTFRPTILAFDMEAGKQHPVAYTADPDEDPMILKHGVCCAEFHLNKRHFVRWVRVERIRVIVRDFANPPANPVIQKMYGAQIVAHVFYYGEMAPKKGAYSKFQRIEDSGGKGKAVDFTNVFFDPEKPTGFVVRVNAKTPGLYTISCEVDLACEWGSRTIKATKEGVFLFLAPDSEEKDKPFPASKK